jgi:hypothetical protein
MEGNEKAKKLGAFIKWMGGSPIKGGGGRQGEGALAAAIQQEPIATLEESHHLLVSHSFPTQGRPWFCQILGKLEKSVKNQSKLAKIQFLKTFVKFCLLYPKNVVWRHTRVCKTSCPSN